MSSEGSVSSASRIGQFGLYRSIDARTEEFLKLSRKRQIRQGCACAAASTAITVTIVIVVFIVFEFSLNSDTKLENTLKSNWFTLMNDTSEESSFNSKLTTNNIDRTTLMLLPLLFKAIKKNAYLEKLLEDSSSNPPYDKRATTEYNINKKTLESRNWFKMPSTKLVAIEYKTSPIVYYRDPTKTIDRYTKIRKIRDYQRVFNYVDKMINDKVYVRPTAVMSETETYTRTLPKDSSVKKVVQKPVTHSSATTVASNIESHDKYNFLCKCPIKFGMLLHKILEGINKLLPETIAERKKLLKNEKIPTTTSSYTDTFLPTIVSKNVPVKPLLFNAVFPIESPPILTTQSENYTFTSDHYLSTDPNIYFYNNIISPTEAQSYERPITARRHFFKGDVTENISPITPKAIQFINRYKNIINRKQVLRKPELIYKKDTITTKTYNKEFLGWTYFDDKFDTLPTSKYIKNISKDFTKTTLSYFNDIEYRIKQIKNEIDPPFLHKKFNLTEYTPKELTFTDIKVDDDSDLDFLTIKPIQINEGNNKNTQNNIIDEHQNEIIDKKSINSNKILRKLKQNINNTETKKFNVKVNPIIPYVDSNENKTTYRFLKNNVISFHNKKQQSKSIPYSSINKTTIDRYIDVPTESYFNKIKYLPDGTSKESNKTVYHIKEKDHNNFLKKNIISVNSLANEQKSQVIEEQQSFSQKNSLKKPEPRENIDGDKEMYLPGKFAEITRQPVNANNKFKQQENINQQILARKITTEKPELKVNILLEDKEYLPRDFSENTRQPKNTSDKLKQEENRNQQIFDHKITSEKPESKENIVGDEAEFLPGEFLEITRQPDNTIDKQNKNVYPKKQAFEFTWEDLKIENVPPWKSMVPESKSMYLEVLQNDLKQDEQEDHDYNIQTNFYDLNL